MASAPSPEAPAAPVAEAAPAPTPAPAPSPAADDSSPDVEEIMNVFSLRDEPLPNFGSSSETPEPPATVVTPPVVETPAPAPAPAAPAAPAAPLPPVTEPAAPPAAVPAAPDALKLASLEATVAALQAQLAHQSSQPAAPAAPSADAPLVRPDEVNYGLTIPNEVLNAVFSEDQATAASGMTHLVNSLANIVHRNVLTAARKDIQAVRTDIQSETSYSAQEQQRRVAQEQYYTTFPAHNNPNIKILVAAEAQKLGAEHPNLPWGTEFMNALGARVNNVLVSLGAHPTQPATTQPAAPVPSGGLQPTAPVQPPPKPASFMPQAPSGGIPAFESGQDLIADTFSFGS